MAGSYNIGSNAKGKDGSVDQDGGINRVNFHHGCGKKFWERDQSAELNRNAVCRRIIQQWHVYTCNCIGGCVVDKVFHCGSSERDGNVEDIVWYSYCYSDFVRAVQGPKFVSTWFK